MINLNENCRDKNRGHSANEPMFAQVLVESGRNEETPIEPDVRIPDLPTAVAWILSRNGHAR